MRIKSTMIAALAVVAMAGMVAIPTTVAGASGSKIWVSNTAPTVGGTGISCAHPGYSTIQSAINNAGNFGATIEVCAGTYVEQLTITNSVKLVATGGPVTVQLPATPVTNGTSCDTALGTVPPGQMPQPGQDEISICGAGNVSITGITVSAYWPPNTCYDNLMGVFVGQGSTLTALGLTVTGAGVPLGDPDVGCQGGIGIRVGSAHGTGQVAHASLRNTVVTGYQKAGIVVAQTGSSLSVHTATITGRGPVGTAENGIEVDYGALGTISGATVSNNNCVLAGVCGPNALTDTQATGILFYGAATGSGVKLSTLNGNDVGVYYSSLAASEPVATEVTMATNIINNSVDAGIELDQGVASLKYNTIGGTGPIGIEVLQAYWQSYAPASTAIHQTISGQGVGVEVDSDNAVGDFPGNFVISGSHFLHTNTTALTNNSTNYTTSGGGNS